jgi:hypothetical protein
MKPFAITVCEHDCKTISFVNENGFLTIKMGKESIKLNKKEIKTLIENLKQ